MGLHMVLIANTMKRAGNRLNRELAVPGGKRDQLATGEPFGSATFVVVDVCCLAADYRVEGLGESFQAEAVGGSAVENRKDLTVLAELAAKVCHHCFGDLVVAVTYRMSAIYFRDSANNFRMNPGIVIAGKTAGRLHDCN